MIRILYDDILLEENVKIERLYICRFVKHMLHRQAKNCIEYLWEISIPGASWENGCIYGYAPSAVYGNLQMSKTYALHKNTHYLFCENAPPCRCVLV